MVCNQTLPPLLEKAQVTGLGFLSIGGWTARAAQSRAGGWSCKSAILCRSGAAVSELDQDATRQLVLVGACV